MSDIVSFMFVARHPISQPMIVADGVPETVGVLLDCMASIEPLIANDMRGQLLDSLGVDSYELGATALALVPVQRTVPEGTTVNVDANKLLRLLKCFEDAAGSAFGFEEDFGSDVSDLVAELRAEIKSPHPLFQARVESGFVGSAGGKNFLIANSDRGYWTVEIARSA